MSCFLIRSHNSHFFRTNAGPNKWFFIYIESIDEGNSNKWSCPGVARLKFIDIEWPKNFTFELNRPSHRVYQSDLFFGHRGCPQLDMINNQLNSHLITVDMNPVKILLRSKGDNRYATELHFFNSPLKEMVDKFSLAWNFTPSFFQRIRTSQTRHY